MTNNLQCFITQVLDIGLSHNINIRSITFNGVNVNFASVKPLGCKFGKSLADIDGTFDYNGYEYSINVFPDPSHMLKLARNALNDVQEFKDGEGRSIKWQYIKELHHLQEEIGLKFGNKISNRHIAYHRHKMNVKISAQTLSSSVADAIEFLMLSNHPSFFGGRKYNLFH